MELTSHQPSDVKKEVDYCDRCSLPDFACLCGITPNIQSNHGFWLITHDNESDKRTNTGRLISATMPDCQVFPWSRVAPDQQLMALLQDDRYHPCLVFPSIYAVADQSVYKKQQGQGKKKTMFVIIDATWQQARKIYRKSPYLHQLPLYSLMPQQPSMYKLRRNQHRQHLCTAEVAAAILNEHDESHHSLVLMALLQVFCDRYQGSKLGQKPDDRFDARRVTQGLVYT